MELGLDLGSVLGQEYLGSIGYFMTSRQEAYNGYTAVFGDASLTWFSRLRYSHCVQFLS